MKKTETNLTPTKKRLFSIILRLLPILFFVVLELLLRIVNYGGNLDLFITGPEKQISQYWMGNPNLGERYFFRQKTKPAPPKDLFLKEKPQNGYRIFVMGGSTAAGFPYGYNVMFSRILKFELDDIFPDKHIEVINTAMSAVNSYTLLDLTDEIIAQKPDAVLIYAGHNEFYGAMGVGSQEQFAKNPKVIRAYLKLRRFKTFLFIRNIVGYLQKSISKATTGGTKVDPTNTLMARIVADQSIPYKSEKYQRGVDQFADNLDRILQKMDDHHIPVILSELVCNIKDQAPFVSAKADSFPTAKHAWEIGKKLEQQGEYKDAKKALYLAKDLDALRFRATEEMNDIIHNVAEKHNAPVVPMKAIFEKQCEHGLIGHELILEHLHPNMQGYFTIADAFFHALKDNHFIADQWDESRIRPIQDLEKNWGLTKLDTTSADLSIFYLKGGWPFKPAIMPNHALENYNASTRVESTAVKVLVNKNYSIVVGHVDLAKYYESKKQYEKAFREYKAALYNIPFEIEFYEGAARNLIELKRYAEALQILETSHKYGSSPFTNKWTGQLLNSHGDAKAALPYLEQARISLPGDQQLLQHLFSCYKALGKEAQAAQLLSLIKKDEIAGSANGEKPVMLDAQQQSVVYKALMEKGVSLIKQKEYSKALPLLKRAHALKQSDYTLKWIGLLDLQAGHVQEAAELLQQAADHNPDNFELRYNLCNAYIHLGRKKEAESVLSEMEALRPNFKDPQKLREHIAGM